jgi:E3 ubiquitin-protein ligase HERC3
VLYALAQQPSELPTVFSVEITSDIKQLQRKCGIVVNMNSAPSQKKIVFSWGAGNQGQLGIGTEAISVSVPTVISSLSDEEIVQITSSGDVSAAVTSRGQVFTWGRTKGAHLITAGEAQADYGVTQTTNLVLPTLIEAEGITFKQVASGKNHAAAITENGRLITWGNPDDGKLGHAPKVETEEDKKKKFEMYKKKGYTPRNYAEKNEIDFVGGELEGKRVKAVACGFQHTAVITEDGDVYTWGHGKSGALGHGNWDQLSLPKKVEGISNIVKIECGIDFTICMDNNNKLYTWGSNRYG